MHLRGVSAPTRAPRIIAVFPLFLAPPIQRRRAMPQGINLRDNIRPILGGIRSVPLPHRPHAVVQPPPRPFVTVSREPGASNLAMGTQLLEALNKALPAEQPWTIWDRELIEKVAADLHLSTPLIDSLEDRGHSWFGDFLSSLALSDEAPQADEAKVYSRVCAAIRALAQAGRVVIVGRGGVFITRRMPAGVHLRLVAPLAHRIESMAHQHNLPADKAAARIKEIEHNKRAFYRFYWPNETLEPCTFTATINTAAVQPAALVDMVVSLVRQAAPVRA
jgi:cytidylate kinase